MDYFFPNSATVGILVECREVPYFTISAFTLYIARYERAYKESVYERLPSRQGPLLKKSLVEAYYIYLYNIIPETENLPMERHMR
jgi:hypothetical protein